MRKQSTERGELEKEWYVHVEIAVERVVYKTDKAVLIRLADGREHWLPLSLTSNEHELPDVEQAGSVWVSKWRAVEEDLPFVDTELHPLLQKPKHPHIGVKVTHKVFGEGEVRAVQGEKVVVAFAAPHGTKTLLARFVGLT